MIDNYLQILEESLHKKIDILKRITAENKIQEAVLKEERVSFDDFEESVDRKQVLIEELNQLDQGFESLYERIKEELLQNRTRYREQIADLQKLIADITDASVSIQAQEARNKIMIEKSFASRRKEFQTERNHANSMHNYYKRMSNSSVSPRFMDKKQ